MIIEPKFEHWSYLTAHGYPQPKMRVMVTRLSGVELIARLDFKNDAVFRPSANLHWLDDDNNFASLGFDPVISWHSIDTVQPLAGEEQDAEMVRRLREI